MRIPRIVGLLLAVAACSPGLPDPPADALRQPTGLGLTPEGRWLLVTGGNWDRAHSGGALWALDLERLDDALSGSVSDAGSPTSTSQPCRRMAEGSDGVECDDSVLIDAGATVFLGTGAGNVGIDRPKGLDGPVRLLIPVRSPASITWVDVTVDDDGIGMECGQGERRLCGDDHMVTSVANNPDSAMPADPANVFVDQEARYAYLPHLVNGRMSLLILDGQAGPELTDIESDFFREDPFDDIEIAGGFAVARRACDPEAPISGSSQCARPYMYSTQRYWPGIREFTIAPGLDVIQGRTERALLGFDADAVELRPFMGDLAFEDPDVGDRLLVVHTTPPGLSRVDTSLDADGNTVNEIRQTVALCRNPNMLEVVQPAVGEALAFVTCFGDDALAVVGLGSFTLVATLPLGEGPNEMLHDPARGWLFVANTREDTISIVGTDPQAPGFLVERARIGLGGRVPED